MKIDGQAGVLGLGFKFLVFMTLHIHTQSILFVHQKIQKIKKVEHPKVQGDSTNLVPLSLNS